MSSHLAIPRPAVTRRAVLGLLGTVAAGCSAPPRDTAPDPAGARLVTVDGATAGLALLLGLPQVGTAVFAGTDPIADAISAVQGTTPVDVSRNGGGLNWERIVSLRPDRVVGLRDAASVPDALAEVTSIHLAERTDDLFHDVERLGAALGHPEQAGAAVRVHRRRRERLRRRFAAEPALPTTSVLSPGLDPAQVYTLSEATAGGAALARLGVPRPPAQRGLRSLDIPYQQISLENLAEHDAELILLLSGATADTRPLRAEPLFAALTAVRAGRVIEVDSFEWAARNSLLGARWALDDLAAILLDRTAPALVTASPPGLARIRAYREDIAREHRR